MDRIDWGKIGEIVQKIKDHNLSYTDGAQQFGIKVRTIYEYNRHINALGQYKETGHTAQESEGEAGSEKTEVVKEIEGIADKGEKGSVLIKSNLPSEIKGIILKYRQEHPDHGYKRIEDNLKSKHFIVVSRKKIREVLKAEGLDVTCDSSFDKTDEEKKKGSRRFEADYPRDLYQMDVTYVYITGIPVLYLVTIIDDYSRFCVGAQLRHDQKGATMIEVLHQAIVRYGKPRKLLTDQGSSFYTWSHESTQFQKYLDDMKIEHIVCDPHSPQTSGKVERLHQTIQRELLQKVRFTGFLEAERGIENYVHSYNYDRPHQGIGGACPHERFHGVIGEVARIESGLASKSIDFSRGYLVLKSFEHTVSVVTSSDGLQVFLDGNLLHQGGKSNNDQG
jgi:transposase InsO family protein